MTCRATIAGMQGLVAPVLAWYAAAARQLPWRQPGTSAYGVLVSEVMLQQTPVSRVREPYLAWLSRWPTAAALARAPSGEALRQWGRLGYPRRALRLHAAAIACVRDHAGQIPQEYDALRALPGVGDYTAAAVASFAFGQRQVVLDTNVRRVLSRAVAGHAAPPPTPRAAERELAEALLPTDHTAPLWSVAVMELGALVCTSRAPDCAACPIARSCHWLAAGRPPATTTRPSPGYAGTDRQVRGRLLALARERSTPVDAAALRAAWPDHVQRDRALASLIKDGLLVPEAGGAVALPG